MTIFAEKIYEKNLWYYFIGCYAPPVFVGANIP